MLNENQTRKRDEIQDFLDNTPTLNHCSPYEALNVCSRFLKADPVVKHGFFEIGADNNRQESFSHGTREILLDIVKEKSLCIVSLFHKVLIDCVLEETGEVLCFFYHQSDGFSYTTNISNKLQVLSLFKAAEPVQAKRISRCVIDPNFNAVKSRVYFTAPDDLNVCVDDLYPYFDFTSEELWSRFCASNSNLLLMHGAPGTGKTAFMRRLACHFGWNNKIIFVPSLDILEHHSFPTFITNLPNGSLLVLDDVDSFIGKRQNGNKAVTNLLSALSGFAPRDLKIMITTNLINMRDVDPALLRPGRCFDVLEFKPLRGAEINAARAVLGKAPLPVSSEQSMTLADALNDDAYANTHGELVRTGEFGFNKAS